MSLKIAIKKKFPGFALDVAFEAENEVFGLLGASGCGKTLTMRCIAGIETPDEGYVIVNGETFFDSEKKINLTPQERKTALLFQNYMLFPNMTVFDNVAAGVSRKLPKAERRAIVMAELERFDLVKFEKSYPTRLSGGQQQRVALARMLAAKPGILMLDEPFSALDSHLKTLLEQNLTRLFEPFQGTVIYVSHDIDEAVRFCDKIAVIEDGKVMEMGAPRSIIDHPRSLAALKLSGVKSTPDAQYVDAHHVFCPQWGVTVATASEVDEHVRAIGIREFQVELADAPGENVFRMKADCISDSRFDRMVLLEFLDREDGGLEVDLSDSAGEMKYLHAHLFWLIDLLSDAPGKDVAAGDEVLIRIPPEFVHVVTV